MKKIYLLIPVFLFIKINLHAQLNYSFSATNSSYSAIVGGANPTLLATTSGGKTDEGYANNISIGFTFNYNGTNYTTLGICTNGFIYLGGSLTNSSITYVNNIATEMAGVRPIIAPLWDDIDVQTETNIKYLVTGTAPNRVLTIEWANALWDPFAASAAISFQVKLYETSNIIEFVYKQEAGSIENIFGGVGASIGITNGNTGDGNYLSLNNSSNNPVVSSLVNTNSINTKPATGQLYRFTPTDSCNGQPSSGNANASILATCANVPFNLNLTAFTSTKGISFQWQSSGTGQNIWVNIPGADSNFVTTTQTNASDYRCIVTCTKSALNDTSNVLTVGQIAAIACTLENDECATATTITQNAYNNCTGTLFNTSLASLSANTSTFYTGSQEDDIWFKFIATNDKAVIRFFDITAVSGTLGNMQFAFYTGTNCNTLTDLGGRTVQINNNEGEVLLYGLTLGNTYFVRVATEGTNWRAIGKICIAEPAIAIGSNNNCISLTTTESTISNHNSWIPIYDGAKLVAEINAQGNTMGAITANLFTTDIVRTFAGNGRPYLSRNIQITPAIQPSTNVKVRLYILNAEITLLASNPSSLVNTINDLYITKNNDACLPNYSGAGTFIIPTARVNYANGGYIEFETSSFSSFYIHGGLGVLPITIQYFNGKKDGNYNLLQWQTINELHTTGFEVQRSTDGKYFSTIAMVPTKATNNNIDKTLQYSFNDYKPLFNSYYRLKQTDKNGAVSYSNIVFISSAFINQTQLIGIYPNPVKDVCKVLLFIPTTTNISLVLTDITGKIITQKNTTYLQGNIEEKISMGQLLNGIYLLKITDINGNLISIQKIVKQ